MSLANTDLGEFFLSVYNLLFQVSIYIFLVLSLQSFVLPTPVSARYFALRKNDTLCILALLKAIS